MEREPVRFLARELEPLLDDARARARRLRRRRPRRPGLRPQRHRGRERGAALARPRAGDELLVTDHAYNACRNALDFVAGRRGREVVVADVPFPARLAGRGRRSGPGEGHRPHAARAARPRHQPDRAGLPDRAARARARARAASTRWSTARTRPAWSRSTSARSAPRTTPATCTSGSARRRAPRSCTCARTAAPASARSSISHGANCRAHGSQPLPPRVRLDRHDDPDRRGSACPRRSQFLGALLPGGWPELMARNRALALRGARRSLCAALGIDRPRPTRCSARSPPCRCPTARSRRRRRSTPIRCRTRCSTTTHRGAGVALAGAAAAAAPHLGQLYNELGDVRAARGGAHAHPRLAVTPRRSLRHPAAAAAAAPARESRPAVQFSPPLISLSA